MSVYPRFDENNNVTSWMVDESTSDAAVNSLLQLIHLGTIDPAKYNHAAIRYNCSKGLASDPEDSEHYALIFSSTKGDVPIVYVGSVTAGYGGTGPHATLKCLEYMDFDASEKAANRITTKPIVNGKPCDNIWIDFFKNVKPRTPFIFGKFT